MRESLCYLSGVEYSLAGSIQGIVESTVGNGVVVQFDIQ